MNENQIRDWMAQMEAELWRDTLNTALSVKKKPAVAAVVMANYVADKFLERFGGK